MRTELEQSDSDSEKGISILTTILVIVRRTKPIFRYEQ